MIGPSEARQAVAYDLAENRETPIPYDILRFNYASVVEQLADYADYIEAEHEREKQRNRRQMTVGGHLAAVLANARRCGRKTIVIDQAFHAAEQQAGTAQRGEPE